MSIFALFARKPSLQTNILFHSETNQQEYHGTVYAENRQLGIRPSEIRFAFEGMRFPPAMTPEVLKYIFEVATARGYRVTELLSYGRNVNASVDSYTEMQNAPYINNSAPQRSVAYTTAGGAKQAAANLRPGQTLQVVGTKG